MLTWVATAGRFSRPVRRLGWYAKFTPRCGPEGPIVLDPEECSRHANVVDRNGRGMVSHTGWAWLKAVSRRKPVHLNFHPQTLVT